MLAFIGDVGSLVGTLLQIANFLLYNILQLDILQQNYLLNRVFRERTLDNPLRLQKLHLNCIGYIESLLCQSAWYICCKFQKRKYRKARKVGLHRIEKELDVVYFIRKQLMHTALIKAMTTKRERSLAKRHRSLVIAESDTTSSSSSSEAEPNTLGQFSIQSEIEKHLTSTIKKQKVAIRQLDQTFAVGSVDLS